MRRHLLKIGMEIATRDLLIHVLRRQISVPHSGNTHERMCFAFKDFVANDVQAQRIAEAVVFASELFYGRPIAFGEEELVIRLVIQRPFEAVVFGLPIKKQLLPQIARSGPNLCKTSSPRCTYIGENILGLGWARCPIILRESWIHDALAFYTASIRHIDFSPSQISEALDQGIKFASNRSHLAIAESAFQNAFKAIEALIGDPSKDESKLHFQIRAKGIDPDELVGWRDKLPIAQAVRKVSQIRDKRAAHGSTPNRGLMWLEVAEAQSCAAHLIDKALSIFDRDNLADRFAM